MRARNLLAATVVAAALIVGGNLPAWAGDTINLNIAPRNSSSTTTLKLAGTGTKAETIDVRGYHGGGGYGRGYYYGGGGYRGGFRVGYYGYGGFGYGGYGYGGYGPIYRSYYGAPVIYAPSVYYASPYYAPISSTVVSTPVITLSIGGNRPASGNLNIAPTAPQIPQLNGDPTYPYDGGPRQPIPMPKTTDASPTPNGGSPAPNLPLEGRTVSLPAQKPTKLTYPAYGDPSKAPASDKTTIVRLPR